MKDTCLCLEEKALLVCPDGREIKRNMNEVRHCQDVPASRH